MNFSIPNPQCYPTKSHKAIAGQAYHSGYRAWLFENTPKVYSEWEKYSLYISLGGKIRNYLQLYSDLYVSQMSINSQ